LARSRSVIIPLSRLFASKDAQSDTKQ
jgi:hypothetical protein